MAATAGGRRRRFELGRPIVIDATNPIIQPGFGIAESGSRLQQFPGGPKPTLNLIRMP